MFKNFYMNYAILILKMMNREVMIAMLIPKDYTIIDLETTGFSPNTNHIIEVACVKVRGAVEIDRLQILIRPPQHIPWRITNITGINNDLVRNAPRFAEVAQQIYNFLHGELIVGHNVRFDINFLRKNFADSLNVDFNNNSVDTIKLCKKAFPHFDSYALENVSTKLGINSEHHRALADCLIVKKVIDCISTKGVD